MNMFWARDREFVCHWRSMMVVVVVPANSTYAYKCIHYYYGCSAFLYTYTYLYSHTTMLYMYWQWMDGWWRSSEMAHTSCQTIYCDTALVLSIHIWSIIILLCDRERWKIMHAKLLLPYSSVPFGACILRHRRHVRNTAGIGAAAASAIDQCVMWVLMAEINNTFLHIAYYYAGSMAYPFHRLTLFSIFFSLWNLAMNRVRIRKAALRLNQSRNKLCPTILAIFTKTFSIKNNEEKKLKMETRNPSAYDEK